MGESTSEDRDGLALVSSRPEQRAVGADSQSRILAALRTLPAAHREAFVLRADEGFSYAEIAQANQTRRDVSPEADREGVGSGSDIVLAYETGELSAEEHHDGQSDHAHQGIGRTERVRLARVRG